MLLSQPGVWYCLFTTVGKWGAPLLSENTFHLKQFAVYLSQLSKLQMFDLTKQNTLVGGNPLPDRLNHVMQITREIYNKSVILACAGSSYFS
jgi:hypothetical protein